MTDSHHTDLISKRIFTPDRAAYFVPVTIGLLISTLFSLILLRPLLIKKNNVYQTLVTYRRKALELEKIEMQYEITRKNLDKALKQKSGLLELIAGPTELQTLISMLNKIANLNDITITGLVPRAIEFSIPQSNNQNLTLNTTQSKSLGLDPLLVEKVIKYPYKISLEGYFVNLLSFLRNLEDLEIITLNSSIKIDNEVSSQTLMTTNSTKKVKASFIISAYGKGD